MTNNQCSIINENDLKELAKKILAKKPQIIALEGPLGAGKTTLTKEIAKELGIKENVISPTYVLETEYRIPARSAFSTADAGGPNTEHYFIHIDCYRMESFDELIRLGVERRIKHEDVIVIEWADKFRSQILDLLPANATHQALQAGRCQRKIIWVKMGLGEKENERIIEIL